MPFATLFLLFFIANCDTKLVCITTESSIYSFSSFNCYSSNSILNVDSSTNILEEVEKLINSETDITLLFSGNFEFNLAISFFNEKILTIQLDKYASMKIDVSNIHNIDMTIKPYSSSSNNYNVSIIGSGINDDQTSLTLNNIDLTSEFSEIQLKSFSISKSTFSFTKFSVGSFAYNDNSNAEITINDNNMIIDEKTIEFTNTNINLALTLNSLILNNQISTRSFASSISLNSNSVTFNGNDFSDSISITLSNCLQITTNINSLPITSISSSSSFKITAQKSVTIKGSITVSSELTLAAAENPSSRISIEIGDVSVTSSYSSSIGIQFLSSWIDLTVDSFKFNSNKIPVVPCVGAGGSSTLIAKEVTYGSTSSLNSNSLSIRIDVTGTQDDKTLATLMSKEWDAVTLKSFGSFNAVEKFSSITYNPSNINGFDDDASILSIRSTVTDDYVITIKASSYTDIPLILCYKYSSCKGTNIDDISLLAESIPSTTKEIRFTIGSTISSIDLSIIKTTGATFTFLASGYSSYSINSLTTSEASENANIDRLIFDSVYFGTGTFQLNAKEITFTNLQTSYGSSPVISFNEQSTLNTDTISLEKLLSYVSGTLPFTNVNGLSDYSSNDDSFQITDDSYIFKLTYPDNKYSRAKLPKVVFHLDISASSNYYLSYIVTAPVEIDSVTIKFETTSTFNYPIQVDFQGLNNLTKANKLEIDFGALKQENIINLNNFPLQKYYVFSGLDVNVINEGVDSNRNLCACKGDGCNSCDEGTSITSYEDLPQRIEGLSETIKITIIDSEDGSSPVISLGILDNKDVTIYGKGADPKIQLDCSAEYSSEGTELYFENITIAHSSGQSFQVTNLIFIRNVNIDTSFYEIPLIVQSLICDVSNLKFKTITVQSSLELTGDPINSDSATKVSFTELSSFKFILPNKITIKDSSFVFNSLEFDLSNVNPEFSILEEYTEYNIIGSDANIDTIGSDITLKCSDKLKSIHVSGTFINENPSKFITFKEFRSDLYLQSENVPISIEYNAYNAKNIILEKETASIAGKMQIYTDYSGCSYTIQSSLTEKTTFKIKEMSISSGSTLNSANIFFSSSTIDLTINQLTGGVSSLKFNMLLGLDNQNTINIIDPYNNDSLFSYNVTCTVTGYLSNPKIKDFIENNHTMITVNAQSTIKTSGNLYFDKIDPPPGFDEDNFKLIVDGNKLIFYTFKSPIEGELNLRYGYCTSCSETELSNNEIANLDHIILIENSNVTVTFYAEIPSEFCLDFDKNTVSIQNLILKVYGSSKIQVPIKFGTAVTNLKADNVVLNVPKDHPFTIQNVTLTNNAVFGQSSNYANVNSLSIDQSSLFSTEITEFSKYLNISIFSSSYSPYSINFTSTGIKISKDQNLFDIDVSKFPDVTLLIPKNSVPIFNLEEGVKELKEIKSLVILSSSIQIGKNWNLLPAPSKVHYTLDDTESSISVTTESFPFEAWDLMFNSKFSFSSSLTSYTFSDKLILNNQNISFNLPNSLASTNDVVFMDVVLSGNSKIESIKAYGNGQLIINKLLVQKGSSSLINSMITDELTLEPESSLNNDFKFNGSLTINIEWNLNQVPTLNSLSAQSLAPQQINIIYKGELIDGREKEFDDFLSKDVVIMNNVNFDISDNVNFVSESVKEFNSGNDLVLKCQLDNNELKFVATKSLIGEGNDDKFDSETESSPLSEESETTSSESLSEVPPTSESLSEEPQQSELMFEEPSTNELLPEEPSLSKSSPEDPTPGEPSSENHPTENPPFSEFEPTVNTYESDSQSIQFTSNGYRESDSKFVPTDNTKDINLLEMRSSSITLTTSYTGEPNSALFVSSKVPESTISISPPSDGRNDYGTGQFGVHANSYNPTVSIPQSKVPLNIFNNMKSDTKFTLPQSSKLLESSSIISLEKLIISKGELNIHVPSNVNQVEFDEVDIYLNSKFNCMNDQNEIETSIKNLVVNQNSHIYFSDVSFAKKIEIKPNSQIEVSMKAKFDEKTTIIELFDTSKIELGKASIEGVCKELKVKSQSRNLHKDNEQEISVELICGANFDCESWADKFEDDDDSVYEHAKCVKRKDGEMCLVVTSKDDDDDDDHKKGLSASAIAGIIIAVVVVVAAVIATVVICLRRNPLHIKGVIIADETSINDVEENSFGM